jgi:K+-sensing histidine kinase KdpD
MRCSNWWRLSALAAEVEARDGAAEGGVALSVTDDRAGVPDNEKSKVIERFYRSDASRATPAVGLDLIFVAAVSRLRGGTLNSVTTTVGCGSHWGSDCHTRLAVISFVAWTHQWPWPKQHPLGNSPI